MRTLVDWGRSEPWQHANGVKTVNVRVGKPPLPKGVKFETMKSTGGVDKWSATRCESVLDTPASYDFGEFATNLVPDGGFDRNHCCDGDCLPSTVPVLVAFEADNSCRQNVD